MAAPKRKATGKTPRITAAQAKAIAARFSKKAPMDAEDLKDGGRDEALEDAQGNLKKSSVIPALDAEDLKDGGVDEATENGGPKLKFGSPEWRAKYGRKSKTVSDALSVSGGK